MDKASAKSQSLEMLKGWSTWLLTLEVAICTVLWDVLAFDEALGIAQMMRFPDMFLYFGWFAFGFSVVVATILVGSIPGLHERLADDISDRSIFYYPVDILGFRCRLRFLVAAEHILFLLGVLLVFIFVLSQGLGLV